MTFVTALEPTAVWGHFDTILTIPRGSKNEERMRQRVVEVAERAGLDYDVDAAGNVVVRKPGTSGHEDAGTTVLQSHLDMVNEKNTDHKHDFATDPIIPQRAGEYLTADGTTLGSDNGIGVATMLAIMEATDLAHGPLECLFTIDEETGLTGALELDASLLKGRRLINLDSEEEGILYVGCAGGGESQLTIDLITEPAASGSVTLAVALTGLKGGHSGCDIHLQRGNAIKLLSRLLWTAYLKAPFRLAGIEGGSAHNAIPREAFALLVVENELKHRVVSAIETDLTAVRAEYGQADPGMELSVETTDPPATVWSQSTGQTVLSLLNALPHGVAAMSYDIPDLVETSINLAKVEPAGGHVTVSLSSRSSIDSALESLRRQVRALGVLAGASVEEDTPYPGWKPNLESHLLEVAKAVHTQVAGHEPEVKAIHAGLECGILGQKAPGMVMISFGPVIEFPHSPDERVQIESVGRFYRLLTATLEQLT
jgi:dipeptidase D